MALIPFGPWLPDQPDFQNAGSSVMTNVLPKTAASYGPAPAMAPVTGPLDARAQGGIYVRDKSSNVWGFAGDATKLYKNVAGSTDWVPVSEVAPLPQLAPAKIITGITQANPGVVTSTAHGYANGDQVVISGVVGMTQVNGLTFTAAGVAANTFQLSGVNTTGYTAYVSGGTAQKIKVITGITQANPGNVHEIGHGFSNGDVVWISGVVGMTQVNNRFFPVTVVDVDHFTIGVDTTAYTAYSSGGTAQKATIYSTNTDERWNFIMFGERCIATNFTDPIQSYVMGASTLFSDLSADAPKARYVARVKDWIMVANTVDVVDGAVPQRVWWPAIDDPTTWPAIGSDTAASLQSDLQDLVGEGGWNMGIVGGLSSADAVVFQERCLWRVMYVGPPAIFSFAVIGNALGTPAPGSIVQVDALAYYLADNGFYATDGLTSKPIGAGQVDRTFWGLVDPAYLYRITSAADPVNKLIYWAFPGPQNSGGTPNFILVYNWELGRFSLLQQMTECMLRALSTGYTLDQLDPFGTLETLPFSLDSRAWTGGRLNLAAFDTSHKVALFNGASLAADMESSEANLNDKGLAHISRVWPMVDTTDAVITVGQRNRLADPVVWRTPTAMTPTTGSAPVRSTAVFQRARLTIPAASPWTHAQGIQVDVRPAGNR